MYDEAERCYYCGEIAGSVDHVVPQVLLDVLRLHGDFEISNILNHRSRIKTVPSCRECNCLLSSKYFDTLQKRKSYLKKRLRLRYIKVLNIPEWEDGELGRMGVRMQEFINQGLRKKDIIMSRLRW